MPTGTVKWFNSTGTFGVTEFEAKASGKDSDVQTLGAVSLAVARATDSAIDVADDIKMKVVVATPLAFGGAYVSDNTTHVGGGGGAGKANFQDISVTKWIDASSFGDSIVLTGPTAAVGGHATGPLAAQRPILVVAENLECLESASLDIGRFLELVDGELVEWVAGRGPSSGKGCDGDAAACSILGPAPDVDTFYFSGTHVQTASSDSFELSTVTAPSSVDGCVQDGSISTAVDREVPLGGYLEQYAAWSSPEVDG